MKLGKVIGRVVSTVKHESMESRSLLLVQGLDEHQQASGTPFVAVDLVQSGEGDIIFYEGGKEAGFAMGILTPVDATIIGHVDQIELDGAL
ncbi:MAG: EutN/CcmL family microcompartment protein [Kiritimatiellales bacterium]|nr:EutN/CcmL family microcompartment protein [Kiritimatiellales bacterium]